MFWDVCGWTASADLAQESAANNARPPPIPLKTLRNLAVFIVPLFVVVAQKDYSGKITG
jgi:hypothetical protein